jgi:NAD+ diphosphatase
MPAATRSQNPFSGARLERRSETRLQPNWLELALADPQTRFVISRGTEHLVRSGPAASIAFLDASHPLVRAADPAQFILLGWLQDSRCVLIDVSPDTTPPLPGCEFRELRPLLGELPAEEGAVLSCARALLVWRSRHRHCGVCGAPTEARNAGHTRHCTSSVCGAEYFPRIDPAIIVLVTDHDQVLLGRQAPWPRDRYSALAGFVEPGESLEDAVEREVFEEVGIRIRGCRYFASQPWPFPASLMLGFHAQADFGPVRLDGELEDAKWFRAESIAAAPPGQLPAGHTIARQLLDIWFEQVTGRPLPSGT